MNAFLKFIFYSLVLILSLYACGGGSGKYEDTGEELSINVDSLEEGMFGINYSQTVQASGGVGRLSWSIVGGGLPDGLTINSSNGVIHGIPKASGIFNFTVRVRDKDRNRVYQDFSIEIIEATIFITTSTLPPAYTGEIYSAILQVYGENDPFSWDIFSGTLPAGLFFDSSTGLIHGIPESSGWSRISFVAYDRLLNQSVPRELIFYVSDSRSGGPVMTNTVLPRAEEDMFYSHEIKVSSGQSPYRWMVIDGYLPYGLTLDPSTGLILGTPAVTGWYSFIVRVMDAAGRMDFGRMNLGVDDYSGVSPLVFEFDSFPDGTRGSSYAYVMQASGGLSPYSWRLSGGNLPPGLSMNALGHISGTLLSSGNFSFIMQVEDYSGISAFKEFTIAVNDPEGPEIATTSLDSGNQGVEYGYLLQASGGTKPYTWSVSSGLPDGITLNSSTGFISGVPTESGWFSFRVQVIDAKGLSGFASLVLEIQ